MLVPSSSTGISHKSAPPPQDGTDTTVPMQGLSTSIYLNIFLKYNVFVCNRLYTIENNYLKGAFFIVVAVGSVLIGGLIGLVAVTILGLLFALCKDYFEGPLLRIAASGNSNLFYQVVESYPKDYPFHKIFDSQGNSILFYTYTLTHTELRDDFISNILKKMDSINIQDSNGDTLLHHVLRKYGYLEEGLHFTDMDPSICNDQGFPPIFEISEKNWTVNLIDNLYVLSGISNSFMHSEGFNWKEEGTQKTLAHFAAEKGAGKDVINHLISLCCKDEEESLFDNNGNSPWFYLMENDYTRISEFLLDIAPFPLKGKDKLPAYNQEILNSPIKQGETVLDFLVDCSNTSPEDKAKIEYMFKERKLPIPQQLIGT